MSEDHSQNGIKKRLSHPWKIGDLCTCTYGGAGEGIIYRVEKIYDEGSHNPQLSIKPVIGIIADKKGKKSRGLSAGWCTPITPRDLYDALDSLSVFIKMEEERRIK